MSPVDSGNGFGTAVFWTAVIPNEDVQINSLKGTAQMHVRNLPQLDYYSPEGNGDLASLGPTWQTGYFDSTVSIDVVWNRPVTRVVKVQDAANGFAGIFAENQATVTWSVNSASGFSFTSDPGNFSTSVPEVPGVSGVTAPLNFFAQIGFERNGIFFPQGLSNSRGGEDAAGTWSPLGLVNSPVLPHEATPGGTRFASLGSKAALDHGADLALFLGTPKIGFVGLSGEQMANIVHAAKESAFDFDWDPIANGLVKGS